MLRGQDRPGHVLGTEVIAAWAEHGVKERKVVVVVVVVRDETGWGQDLEGSINHVEQIKTLF